VQAPTLLVTLNRPEVIISPTSKLSSNTLKCAGDPQICLADSHIAAEVIFELPLLSLRRRAIIVTLRHRKFCTLFDQIANFIVFSPTINHNIVEPHAGVASSQWTYFSIRDLYAHER
jgi:hypothetical protein